MVAPQYEQELAHVLLIELLAYQFTMPVRWIETQDVILNHYETERLVEVGPSSTLLNMARRTLESRNQGSDDARVTKRRLLSVVKDYKEVCYDIDPAEGLQEHAAVAEQSQPLQALPPVLEAVIQATGLTAETFEVPAVPDTPIPAVEAVKVLVAYDLKKSTQEISLDSTIKEFAGGRSTVQNEIVGDLLEEFGSLPNDAENTSLGDLASAIQTTYEGKLGKRLRSLVAKMIASKMPGGFDTRAARQHLSERWGLAMGRQDAVLLSGVTRQPASRLDSVGNAQSFLDVLAGLYTSSNGLTVTSTSSPPQDGRRTEKPIDSRALNEFRREQDHLNGKIIALLGQHVSANSPGNTSSDAVTQKQCVGNQAKLDYYDAELGDVFLSGIKPQFQVQQARSYDSCWNWAQVDLIELYHCLISGDKDVSKQEMAGLRLTFRHRWNDRLRNTRKYLLDTLSNCQDRRTTITRQVIDSLETREVKSIPQLSVPLDLPDLQMLHPLELEKALSSPMDLEKYSFAFTCQCLPREMFSARYRRRSSTYNHRSLLPSKPKKSIQLLTKQASTWMPNHALTDTYLKTLNIDPLLTTPPSGRDILVTGAGPSSIGATILQRLLKDGARVAVATSRPLSEAGPHFQEMYARCGGNGSRLVVLPCNQGSRQDLEALVAHIYDPVHGLGWDLDHIIPFAAVSQTGREIDNIDSRSELAHRVMLLNVIRLLGAVKAQKQARGSHTRPAQVLLPLSPNRGTFGKDGLYSESKLALMALLNKWSSESWGDYLSICGVVIGWTRGTGLMAGNDMLAEAVGKLGVKTFSQDEMAYNILALMKGPIVSACQDECIMADFNGGLDTIADLASFTAQVRKSLRDAEEIKRAIARDVALDIKSVEGGAGLPQAPKTTLEPRANIDVKFPRLPDYTYDVQPLRSKLEGMVDLESVVVVVGFAEVGPWGSSRTRWEMEAFGTLSLEGWIEMAWIMGLIKRKTASPSSDNGSSGGWVDVETGTPVADKDVQTKYEKHILAHAGIRLLEPRTFDHPDREKKQFLQEVVIQHDMDPFETSHETALDFRREHGDKVDIQQVPGSDEYNVCLKKGAILMIPKAAKYEHTVGGQVPAGWNPKAYGVPESIINHVDRCTLFALVCAAEAFLSAGIPDVYELYQHIHASDLATCVGSGMGGNSSLHQLYRQRYLDKPVPNDILAETFINTTSAWLNMLLLSSSGPHRTPVGACATALEALNQGYDLIASGTAKCCLVGGFDDMTNDTSHEFANMKATNNSTEDMRRGRAPHETSRPTASSRSGFVESEGCGMQVLTSAKLALELGLPIHTIVASVQTASDKTGRSVPAPGKGIMTAVCETPVNIPSPLLNIEHRRRNLKLRMESIRESAQLELDYIHEVAQAQVSQDPSFASVAYLDQYTADISLATARQEKEARRTFGNAFWTHDTRISPLRGALAVWNLTIDDVAVASLHGTSTQLNEKNEVEILHRQLAQLGRTKGNAILAVCQKYLTGHPKGAAAAWMLNGCCQMLDSGMVPGNRNADNIDANLAQWDHVVFPNRSIQTKEVNAFSVTSFGFGQKGAQALGVHPRYLYATIREEEYRGYCARREVRERKARKSFQDAMEGNRIVVVKERPPYEVDREVEYLTDASARVRSLQT